MCAYVKFWVACCAVATATVPSQLIADEPLEVNVASSPQAVEKARARMINLLAKPHDWTAFDGDVHELASRLKTALECNVLVDQYALDDVGFNSEQTISLPALKQLPSRSYMWHALRDARLAYFIRDEALVITTKEAAESELTTQVYPIADLLRPNEDVDLFIQMIFQVTPINTWDTTGGAGAISGYRQSLVVSATHETQQATADFIASVRHLKKLIKEKAELPVSIQLDSTPTNKAIYAALERKTSLAFDEATLEEVAAYLRRQFNINVVVDRQAIQDIRFDESTRIKFDVEQMALHHALRSLLRKHDLTHCVQKGALLLTTTEASEELQSVRLYPVADLAYFPEPSSDDDDLLPYDGPQYDFDSLIELLTSTIAPQSWDEGSGQLYQSIDDPPSLAFPQSDYAHREIEMLLAKLRRAEKESVKLAPKVEPFVDDGKLWVQTYYLRVNDDGTPVDDAKDIETCVTRFVAPDTWQREGVAIQVMNGRLIVRQTKTVHRKLQRYLTKFGFDGHHWPGGGFGGVGGSF